MQHLVYLNTSNWFNLNIRQQLSDATTVPLDWSDITKATIRLDSGKLLSVDRDAFGAAINWWDAELPPGDVRLSLGEWAAANNVAPGHYSAELRTFAPDTRGEGWVRLGEQDWTLIFAQP